MENNGKASAPNSFRETRYIEKKKAMIKSAAKAFGRKGFHAATIEEIASHLRMTKGSLYYYFSTKEELLFEAHRASLNEVLENINNIIDSSDSPEVKLRKTIIGHLNILAQDYEGAFLLQQEYILPENYKSQITELRDEYEKKFRKIIEDGVNDGLFKNTNIKISTYCMLGAINWFLRWYSSQGPMSSEQIGEAFADFFINGLRRQPEAERVY
ncbi:MAG: TetR/AcrR family transcriptional regulator [Thermodesulfobacteriota bacterium]